MKPTVLITVASAGFGKSCAQLLAENGYPLVLSARREDKLEEIKTRLSPLTPVHTLKLDVRDREMTGKSLTSLPEPFSKVDILINNAGLALGLSPAHQADLDDWDTMIDTNIKGLTYCTRALLPKMVERGCGHIVNLGSVAGSWPYPGGNTYGATKAFVQQFSNNLRADLHGTGVRVTNIEPGLAETEFSQVRFKGDSSRAEKVYDGVSTLLPEDIAETVLWVIERPPHVNINRVEVMPTCQSFASLSVHRK